MRTIESTVLHCIQLIRSSAFIKIQVNTQFNAVIDTVAVVMHPVFFKSVTDKRFYPECIAVSHPFFAGVRKT